MDQPVSPTVGKRCELVGMIGAAGVSPLRRVRGLIVARNQGQYTVELERDTREVREWCRENRFGCGATGSVLAGPGRIRVIGQRMCEPTCDAALIAEAVRRMRGRQFPEAAQVA